MKCSQDFDPADTNEFETFGIDFVNDLAPGDAIAAVVSFSAELVSGTDPNYATTVNGDPSFDGTLVSCFAGGFQPGCRYRLIATVYTMFGKDVTLYADVVGEEY